MHMHLKHTQAYAESQTQQGMEELKAVLANTAEALFAKDAQTGKEDVISYLYYAIKHILRNNQDDYWSYIEQEIWHVCRCMATIARHVQLHIEDIKTIQKTFDLLMHDKKLVSSPYLQMVCACAFHCFFFCVSFVSVYTNSLERIST